MNGKFLSHLEIKLLDNSSIVTDNCYKDFSEDVGPHDPQASFHL